MPHSLTRREALGALAGALPAGAANKRYNVLFLMSDEHSPHALGYTGNKIVRTPALDGLAARGTAFSAAYCQNPICVPSRASFVTGRMPSNVGVIANDGGLRPEVITLADVFKKAGYAAGWVGKQHWGGDPRFDPPDALPSKKAAGRRKGGSEQRSRLPEDAAIADWPASDEADTITKESALRFLDKYHAKPFFLGVSFVKPHFPFVVQQEYYRIYDGKLDAPRVTPQMLQDLPLVSKQEREKYGFAKLTDGQIRRARAVYYGMVTYIDDQIRDILGKLDQLGLRDNTIILYTADHGEMAGEHGLWYKNCFYEGSARLPHVWSLPGVIPAGRTIGAPTMNMDIFPTLCDLCGLPKPAGLEGTSLVPLFEGADSGAERYALSENFRNRSAGRMLRTSRWKYCYFHEDRQHLFDMRNDPAEEFNLVAKPEHKELVASLRARALEGWPFRKLIERSSRTQ
jgi:choline-sulfatase